MQHEDEESQNLLRQKNPQDAPQQYGQKLTSYSDWSNYDKQETPVEDDGVKCKLFLFMGIVLILVGAGHHFLSKSQRAVPFEEKSHLNRTHSNAIQDALAKINNGAINSHQDDEDDLRRQEEFDRRLALEREREQAIQKSRQQQQQKPIDDKQTIDDLLSQYIAKAQNPEPEGEIIPVGIDDYVFEEAPDLPFTPALPYAGLTPVEDQVEQKLLEQQELNMEPQNAVIKLEELQISEDSELDDLIDEIEQTPVQIEEQLKETQIILEEPAADDDYFDVAQQPEKAEISEKLEKPEDVIVPEKQIFESSKSYLQENYDESNDQYLTVFEDIVKPQSSLQEFRLLILPNQVKVLLIHDKETFYDFGLSMRVGSWDDPASNPGLTNLMQHMLIEGIEVDDQPSLYESIQHSNGITEGLTEDIFTNFVIETLDIVTFQRALKDFVSVLSRPVLKPQRVADLAKEVEGEDTITLVGDNWKLQDIIKILAKPQHPVSHQQSLWLTDKQTYSPEMILNHYDQHFSSNLISVVLKSDQSLDTLQKIILESDIKKIINKDLKTKEYNPDDLPLNNQNIIFKFHTVAHDFGLKLLVQIAKYSHYNEFFAYLLSQRAEGSLAFYLQSQQLSTDIIKFNGLSFAETYHFSTITFEIADPTKAFVVARLFTTFVKFLQEQDLSHHHRDFLSITDIRFHFQDPNEELNILMLAQRLHQEKYESLLKSEAYSFDAVTFNEYLEQYVQNYIILLGRKEYKLQAQSFAKNNNLEFLAQTSLQSHNEEFRLDYSMQPIEIDNLKMIKERDSIATHFTLPRMSTMVPHNYELVDVCENIENSLEIQDEEETRYQPLFVEAQNVDNYQQTLTDPVLQPIELKQQHPLPKALQQGTYELCSIREKSASLNTVPFRLSTSVWWKPSHIRRMPRVFMGLFVQRPETRSVEFSKTLVKVHQRYLQELFKQDLSVELSQLGYEIHIENHINGLNLFSVGWSDTQDQFLTRITEIVSGKKESSQEMFNSVKEKLLNEITHFYEQKLSTLTQQYYFPYIMMRPIHTPEQIEQTLESITYRDFEDYTQSLFQAPPHVELAFLGNLQQQEAQRLAKKVLSELNIQPTEGSGYQTKTLNLKGQSLIYAVQGKGTESAIMNFYQTGPRNYTSIAALSFVASYLQTERFQIQLKSIGCLDGLSFYTQTQEKPDKANLEIEMYILQKERDFLAMTSTEFEEMKWKVINNLQELRVFDGIAEESLFVWERILNMNFAFDELQQLTYQLEQMEKIQLELFYDQLFRGENHGKMSVQVFSQMETEEFKLASQDGALRESQTASGTSERVVFGLEDLSAISYYPSFFLIDQLGTVRV